MAWASPCPAKVVWRVVLAAMLCLLLGPYQGFIHDSIVIHREFVLDQVQENATRNIVASGDAKLLYDAQRRQDVPAAADETVFHTPRPERRSANDEVQLDQHNWISDYCKHPSDEFLQVLCKVPRGIWETAATKIGKAGFITSVGHAAATHATLAGKKAMIWYDRRDLDALHMLREQVHDEYRLRHRLQGLGQEDWVLDFGGNIGTTAICEARIAYKARVLTLEPSPLTFLYLVANLESNDVLASVTPVNAGLGATKENFTASAGIRKAAGNTFVAGPNVEENISPIDRFRFRLDVVTLPDLMVEYNIRRIGFVKLDCEQCEWRATGAWAKAGLLERIPVMVGEFHPPKDLQKQLQSWKMTLSEATFVYDTLCRTPRFHFSKGCKHHRLDAINSDAHH